MIISILSVLLLLIIVIQYIQIGVRDRKLEVVHIDYGSLQVENELLNDEIKKNDKIRKNLRNVCLSLTNDKEQRDILISNQSFEMLAQKKSNRKLKNKLNLLRLDIADRLSVEESFDLINKQSRYIKKIETALKQVDRTGVAVTFEDDLTPTFAMRGFIIDKALRNA